MLLFVNVSFATDTNDNTTNINNNSYKDLEVNSTSLHALILNEENNNYIAILTKNNTPVSNFPVSLKISNFQDTSKFKYYNLTTNDNGVFTIPINLALGTYSIETYPSDYYKYNNYYLLNKDYIGVYSEGTVFPDGREKLSIYDSHLGVGLSISNNKDLIMSYGENKNFTVNVNSLYPQTNNYIDNGVYLKLEFIRLKDNAYRTYYLKSVNDVLSIPINLAVGNYKVNIYSENNYFLSSNYIIVKDNKSNYFIDCDSNTKTYIVGFLKSLDNVNPLNKEISINITRKSDGLSKEYTASVNEDGYFSLPVNLGIGEYSFSCLYNGTLLYTNKFIKE